MLLYTPKIFITKEETLMQFFKFEGIIANPLLWQEEKDNRDKKAEATREISFKSDLFNENLKKKSYFFVASISDTIVTLGALCSDSTNISKNFSSFITSLNIETTDSTFEEVSLSTLLSLLRSANRNSYIDNEDFILEQFELDLLNNSSFGARYYFGENMLEKGSKSQVYEDTKKFLASETIIPELDRIYAKPSSKKTIGHPVHYLLQTDDLETRKDTYRLILQALYANNRIVSKRYFYVNLGPKLRFSRALLECLYKASAGGTVVIRYSTDEGLAEDDIFANTDRELIEVICEFMKKYRNQVLTVLCLTRECARHKKIFYEFLGNISFVEIKEEFVQNEQAFQFLEMIAKNNKVRIDKNLFLKIEKDRGYLAPELRNIFEEWYDKKLKTDIFPQYKNIETISSEEAKAQPKGYAYHDLMEMVGLDEAKNLILNSINYFKAQKKFADKGMKYNRPSMHMVFTGNPGTAKTSVARLFARIMKDNNLLSKGHLVEVGRADIVGKYVGSTAPLVKKAFKDAKGGVLFIDEAYSLVDDKDGLFGDEAINTIVQEMENLREEVVVIFAGYPDKMERFLQKNPGLRSRIANHVNFPDYDTESLLGIATIIANKNNLVFSEDAYKKLESVFDTVRTEKDFGNGRYVRNILEKAKMALATRLLSLDFDSVTTKDVETLLAEDIQVPINQNYEQKQIGF